jgi:hypothetical protein
MDNCIESVHLSTVIIMIVLYVIASIPVIEFFNFLRFPKIVLKISSVITSGIWLTLLVSIIQDYIRL